MKALQRRPFDEPLPADPASVQPPLAEVPADLFRGAFEVQRSVGDRDETLSLQPRPLSPGTATRTANPTLVVSYATTLLARRVPRVSIIRGDDHSRGSCEVTLLGSAMLSRDTGLRTEDGEWT